jgi:hypothetical protein
MADAPVPPEPTASTTLTNTVQPAVATPTAAEPPKADEVPHKRPSPWTENAVPQPVTPPTSRNLLSTDFEDVLRPILDKLP